MPQKIRELKATVSKAGFLLLPGRGKGTHTRWVHPLLPDDPLTIPGKDGDDVPRYLEKQVKQVLKRLDRLKEEEDK